MQLASAGNHQQPPANILGSWFEAHGSEQGIQRVRRRYRMKARIDHQELTQ